MNMWLSVSVGINIQKGQAAKRDHRNNEETLDRKSCVL